MTQIKAGDIVRVNVKLTAVAVGHDVKCLYKRPDGSTRPVYIPVECLEVVDWKRAAEIGPEPEDPESRARTELKGNAPDYSTIIPIIPASVKKALKGKVGVVVMKNEDIKKELSPDDYQTHVDLATGHDKTVTAYKCTVCGKVCKAAIGLSGHMRSHKTRFDRLKTTG